MIATGAARLAGVIGWPVAQSRSPAIHQHWIAEHGLDAVFAPLPVRPEHFADALAMLPRLGCVGASVTIPHKEAAFALSEPDEAARRAGAVNLLTFTQDGRILGRNTDGWGCLANLAAAIPGWRATVGPAVVLGAGGAARGIAAALQAAGAPDIRLVNRSHDRAGALAAALGPPVSAWAWEALPALLADAALLINATSLGMAGQPPLPIDLAPAAPGLIVHDIVFKPLETALLSQARAQGLAAVDGLGMLLWQAVPAFEAWFGVRPAVTPALRAAAGIGL